LFGLAFLFTGLALVQLDLVNRNLGLSTFIPLFVLMLCSGLVIYFLQPGPARQRMGDPVLLPLIFFLSGLGLVLIRRLAPAFLPRQLFWLVIATVLLTLVARIPKNLDWLRRYKYTWLIGGLSLLASTLYFGVNPSGFGARLWLQVGNIFFQPSEILKLLLIVFLAGYIADRRYQLIKARAYIGPLPIPHPSYWGPMLLMWGFSIILLVWQRDLGAALLFFGAFLGMIYTATGQARYIWAGAALLVMAGMLGYILFDVVQLRVEGFLNPWLDPSGRSFQIVQSLLAFASGGVFGQGLGQGLPTAIPVVHTDFVYAAIGEEYGLLGALGVLACFALLVARAFRLALRSRDEFEQLLAVGIGTMLALQTLVITAGALKLMPMTGVTLPFVSYGGSSLIASFLMVGLLTFMARGSADRSAIPASSLTAREMPLAPHNIQLAQALLAGFLIVAGGLVFWQVALAPFLVNRNDNPRLVVAEQKIQRGRLLSRDGIPVAETIVAEDGLAQRRYPYPSLATVTGYYSIRHGVGGVEALYDPILRGVVDQSPAEKLTDDLLHRPLAGRDVRLTIDLPAQVAADLELGAQEGAVVVMDIESGAVLVMSSHPTYDPNTLDDMWNALRQDERAPLLNRASQGIFPIGDLARLIGLIGLYEAGATRPAKPFSAPVETLVAPLGPTGYLATAQQLGLARPLIGLPSQPGLLPELEAGGRSTVRDLAVTPLHLARVIAGLENEGYLPNPILSFSSEPSQSYGFRADTAQAVRSWLPQIEQPQIEDQIIGLTGQASPKETGQRSLSWFVGLAPTTAVPVAEFDFSSPALSDDDLILDPSKIEAIPPTPTLEAAPNKARYVAIAVVVTDTPEDTPAFRIAMAPLRVLLGR
jgi:cell division protein FtsW (lipid II flippase)